MANDSRHLFTADIHWSHGNIIKYSCRPFLSDAEKQMQLEKKWFRPSQDAVNLMNRTIVEKFNEVARPQDILWILGDLAWNGKRSAAEFLNGLNCKNINFIWGNHDDWDIADLIPRRLATPECGIEQLVQPIYDQALIIVDGQKIHLSHYPNDSWEDSHKDGHRGAWHFYGHVHGNRNLRHVDNPAWAFSLDVGVDSHNFYPWTLEQIRKLFEKRKPAWDAWRAKMKDKEDGGMKPVCQL
jgi:calcineurin-like phosphoesterase family protein